MTIFVPIFTKDDNEFFIAHNDFVGETEALAWAIGIGSLPEQALYKFSFTGQVKEIDPHNTPHRTATLETKHGTAYHIAVIKGPLFDEVEQEKD